MKKLAWFLPFALSGCLGEMYRNPVANPFHGVRRVAVAPFLDRSGAKGFDGVKAGDAFASEILMHDGFDVVRPGQVAEAAASKGLKLETADDYLAVAAALNADAIVVAEVTELNTYYPPRTTVALQLLLTQRVKGRPEDLDRHVESARPLAISPTTAPHLDQHFELVADAGSNGIQDSLSSYAAARVADDSPWEDGEGIARSREPYWRFCCALLVDRIIENEQSRPRPASQRWSNPEHP
jgi:hypothetical protein